MSYPVFAFLEPVFTIAFFCFPLLLFSSQTISLIFGLLHAFLEFTLGSFLLGLLFALDFLHQDTGGAFAICQCFLLCDGNFLFL